MKKTESYQEHLLEDLKDPSEAVAYLNAAIEAGNREAFLIALRNVITAHGPLARIARNAHIHRVSLHKMLTKEGNPSAESLIALFRVLGLRFVFEKREKPLKHFRKAA